jgi:hypothetical protein
MRFPARDRGRAGLAGVRRGLPAVLAVLTVLATSGGGQAATRVAGSNAPAVARPASADPAVVLPKTDCAALAGQDLSGVPDAPAIIGSARPTTSPQGWAACDVKGTVAPQIQFEAWLPTTTWRQRYLQVGCGAFCGNVGINAQAAAGCVPLTRGDFVMASDNEGHVGVSGFDGVFGADPQLRVDLGYRSDHVVSVVVKRLIGVYYGQGPRHSYFDGCSQGGHEGLAEAQRYPADFDGIVAGAPASIFTPLNVWFQGWNGRVNTGAHGRPVLTADKLAPLHSAVLTACDGKDGLADGQIDDPRACAFDPASLRCAPGANTAGCLTDTQIGVVRKLYEGPRDERGRRLYPGGEAIGSELAWANWIVPTAPGAVSIARSIATSTLKYLAYPAARPSMTLDDLAFDSATFRETYEQAGVYDATDPDLSAFRAKGGKLIIWHGWADQAISPYGTVAYYHALADRMGGRAATQRFARLFMLPGVNHCGGGEGPDAIDALTATVDWVEGGLAPDRLIATRTQGNDVVRTRPVYPYPLVARYDGTGSTDEASNFAPAPPPADYGDGVSWLGSFRSGYERTCAWRNGRWSCTRTPPAR